MSLTQNQFSQIPVQGQLDLGRNYETIACQVDTTTGGSLVPGQAVKMYDSAGGVPKVVECAADTDDVFGFLNYDLKNATFGSGDPVEVSQFRGNVMYMTASAAIARNAQVMIVVASKKVATATSGKRIIGRALDKATADGDVIRVEIDLPGALA